MFTLARIKLTAWYLLIIMVISALFSLAIFETSNFELDRIARRQQALTQRFFPDPDFINGGGGPPLELYSIDESRQRLINNLLILNAIILIFAGGSGYFLAGRTLKPIKEMVDDQNRFVSDASHELRTPLTALRTSIEVNLRDKKLSLNEAKNLIESNLSEVKRLQSLSDNLLILARAQNNNKTYIEKVKVEDVVSQSVQKLEVLASQKGINLVQKVKKGEILAIKDDLISLMTILVDNAIKYSPPKSNVEIEAFPKGYSFIFSVADHGIGIDQKNLPHIFDRFYRVDKSRSVVGYGLGLSIAKKIVDKHHGSIEVKSKPGKGTTFIVFLPIDQSTSTTNFPTISRFMENLFNNQTLDKKGKS